VKQQTTKRCQQFSIFDTHNLYFLRYLVSTHAHRTHAAGGQPYPFPRDLFNQFVDENDGYFPVTIEALPEGTVAYIHTPVFIISAEEHYSRLCTFLETILTMVWYPSCVATLSRYSRDAIQEVCVCVCEPKFACV